MLKQHPSVGFAFQKEVHYFDRICKDSINRQRFSRNVRKQLLRGGKMLLPATRRYVNYVTDPQHSFTDQWYQKIFTDKPENRRRVARGERIVYADASPSYMSMPEHGVQHMAELLPDAKPVLVVRDPVRRMVSGLSMVQARNPQERNRSVERQIRFLKKNQVPRGDYARAIPLFRKHFGDIHLIPFGQIRTRPRQVMRGIEKLSGLSPISYTDLQTKKHSHTGKVELSSAVKSAIESLCAPQYDYLRREFGADFLEEI
ncbi:MAG TPA: hypothetical protein ENJ90_08315 [Devosia sp.]|nr:hypothetical protein [Devosia sp.]